MSQDKERLPRHGETGAYPDFIDPDSLIDVVNMGPRGGYTPGDAPGDGLDEQDQPRDTTHRRPLNPIVDYLRGWYTRQGKLHDEWIGRRSWAVRWIGRWTLKTSRFSFKATWMGVRLIGRWTWIVLVETLSPPRRRRQRRGRSRGGGDYRGGRFPRNGSRHKDRRNNDYGSEETG